MRVDLYRAIVVNVNHERRLAVVNRDALGYGARRAFGKILNLDGTPERDETLIAPARL